jgi:hypothetical protein
LILILISTLVMIRNLWLPGIPNRGDMLMSIQRVFELADAWQFDIYYPRLGPNLNFNYTAPLFEFYPPLSSYVGLAFYGAGLSFIQASKATLALSILVAGLGMYFFVRDLVRLRAAAGLAAIAYLSAPYLMTDVFERGAVAETVALALLPWLFWSLRSLVYRGSRWHLWLSVGLTAGMILAHNGTAIFFVPAAGLHAALLAVRDRKWRGLLLLGIAGVLGVGLSAFYWLPALAEVKFTRAEEYMLGDIKDVENNLLAWRHLVQPTWIFHYAGETRFHFARWLAVLGAISIVTLPFHRPWLRSELALLALAGLATLFLQVENARFFWESAPLVKFIQFSWRLYGLTSFYAASLVGALMGWPSLSTPVRWAGALILSVFCIGVSIPNLKPDRLPLWYEIDEANIHELDLFERGRTGHALFSDYSPIGMKATSGGLTMPRIEGSAASPPLSSAPAIRVEAESPFSLRLAVDAPASFPLRISRIFFPGWQVHVDGQRLPATAGGQFGLVTAELPAGTYTATIRFEQTPVRQLADGLTIATLALWGALLIDLPQRRWRWLVRGGIVLLVLLAALYWQFKPKAMRHPLPAPANFQNQVHLLGYELPKTTWRPGEEVELHLYWLAQQTPSANYKILLHMVELDDSGKVAQADSEPILGFNPMTTWEPGMLVVDEHRLPLESAVKPGHYQLVVGVYHPETVQNLPVSDAETVLPGDRVVLAEVEIRDE